jgi:acyl-CoA thioesterase I
LLLSASGPHHTLSILAIGSSSTEGVAASSPTRAYPAQLSAELASRFHVQADVRNAGVGGETAEQTLIRLKGALGAHAPDLVIWQVGTNDAMRRIDETRFRAEVDAGIEAAQEHNVPMILIDPQLTPAGARDARYADYAGIVKQEGERLHTPVVSRFAMMQSLAASDPTAWNSLLSPDGMHMNDLGYSCLARSLAAPIAAAVSGRARL